MSLQKNLGITLKALRAEKGVSQEKLALNTGIDRRYMSDIENVEEMFLWKLLRK